MTRVNGFRAKTITGGIIGKVKKRPVGFGIKEAQRFVGVEITRGKKGKLKLSREFRTKKSKKRLRLLRNLASINQVTLGRIAIGERVDLFAEALRKKKFIKGKKARGIKLRDFASASVSFTKKDLTLIVGKTITNKKERVKFIGLIKASKKAGTKGFEITSREQKLFQKALVEVIGTITASTIKSKKVIPKLSPSAKKTIAKISRVSVRGILALPTEVVRAKLRVKRKIKVKEKLKIKTTTGARVSLAQLEGLTSGQKKRLSQISNVIARTQVRFREKLSTKQRQALRQKFSRLLKQRNFLIARGFTGRGFGVPRIPFIPILLKKGKKKIFKKKKKAKKKKQGYSVFARPIKKRKGRKITGN